MSVMRLKKRCERESEADMIINMSTQNTRYFQMKSEDADHIKNHMNAKPESS